jgi:hypothetical protein
MMGLMVLMGSSTRSLQKIPGFQMRVVVVMQCKMVSGDAEYGS